MARTSSSSLATRLILWQRLRSRRAMGMEQWRIPVSSRLARECPPNTHFDLALPQRDDAHLRRNYTIIITYLPPAGSKTPRSGLAAEDPTSLQGYAYSGQSFVSTELRCCGAAEQRRTRASTPSARLCKMRLRHILIISSLSTACVRVVPRL